ncbi:MAG: hypothetical protein ABIJ09_20950 [Pseudomonadota bacterium]
MSAKMRFQPAAGTGQRPRGTGHTVLVVLLSTLLAASVQASDQGATPSSRGRGRSAGQRGGQSHGTTPNPQPTQVTPQANPQSQAHGQGSARPGQRPPRQGHAVSPGAQPSHVTPHQGRTPRARSSYRPGYAAAPRQRVVVRQAPRRVYYSSYVATPQPYAGYVVAAPPPVATYMAPAPAVDRFDLGVGMGLVGSAPQLQGGLPLLTGKIRALGMLTPRLGLGLDLDVASMLLVNHATVSAVVSYDLTAGSPVALRPYVSLGAGALNLITDHYLFLGPAVSARAGIEFKPWRWLGFSLEAGSVASMMNGLPVAVPYAGGTLALYLL